MASVFHPSSQPLSCPFGIASQVRFPWFPGFGGLYILYCTWNINIIYHEISPFKRCVHTPDRSIFFSPTETAAEVAAAARSEHDGPPSALHALEDRRHVGWLLTVLQNVYDLCMYVCMSVCIYIYNLNNITQHTHLYIHSSVADTLPTYPNVM